MFSIADVPNLIASEKEEDEEDDDDIIGGRHSKRRKGTLMYAHTCTCTDGHFSH